MKVSARTVCIALAILMSSLACMAGEPPKPSAKPFLYIAWDGHRFGHSAEEMERDVQYFTDLGFTHSLLSITDAPDAAAAAQAEKLAPLYKACKRYEHSVGLRFGWGKPTFDGEGMLLNPKAEGFGLGFNPLHPEIIDYYTGRFGKATEYHCAVADGTIGLFLIGSEYTWGLPPQNKVPEAAQAIILAAAREDGILREDETDWKKLGGWWSAPKGKGRDWRLRVSLEKAVRQHVPEARFMIDPNWAAKLPGKDDLGATWTYLGAGYPKGMADSVIRLKSMCWPNPITHSTQLIRGAHHDMILMANLMSLCMGADSLYHWGTHTIEPGRRANPWYRIKDPKLSPVGFPRFDLTRKERHPAPVADWGGLLQTLAKTRETDWGKRLWALLNDDARDEVEAGELQMDGEVLTVEPEVKAALAKALNQAVGTADLFSVPSLKKLKLNARGEALLKHLSAGTLLPGPAEELNRLAFEAALGGCLHQTASPNEPELLEKIDHARLEKEPALRSTGRFIRDRGDLMARWKPCGPRVGLLSGMWGPGDLTVGMMAGHIPYELLRNAYHRSARIGAYETVMLTRPKIGVEDYRLLQGVVEKGGTIFVPKGFKAPEGEAALARSIEWDPTALGKRIKAGKGFSFNGDFADYRAHVHGNAKVLRSLLRKANFLPLFDSENLDVVLAAYESDGQRYLFAVNDRRGDDHRQGAPNTVTFLLRDKTKGLRLRNVDTGAEVPLTEHAEGYTFTDALPQAWYGLYAILAPDAVYKGPAPLNPGPALEEFTALRGKRGVELSWKVAVKNWVGCDLQWYRIYRSKGTEKPELLKEIYARDLRGPGKPVTGYADNTAKAGIDYTYQMQTVTPLRVAGPLSKPVRVR